MIGAAGSGFLYVSSAETFVKGINAGKMLMPEVLKKFLLLNAAMAIVLLKVLRKPDVCGTIHTYSA